MRLVYVIPGLDRSGGAEQAVAAMAAPFAERGVRLDVVTLTGRDDLAAVVEQAGGSVIDVGPGSVPQLTVKLRRVIHERRPDLVHTTLFDADIPGRLAARAAGVPVVSSLVNVAYGPEQRANPAIRAWKLEGARRADQASARLVRRFHALSSHVAVVMGDRLAIPADKIDVIPRGRDDQVLGEPTPERRAATRRLLDIDADQPLVIAAARHEFQKGLDVLVRAWPAIRAAEPTAQLRLAGRAGNQSDEIERLIADLGADSGIVDLGSRADVADLMGAADAWVVPSRWEGLGSVLIEAMALGTPVVATEVGPIPEVVGAGWARLVGPEDPHALAEAVLATIRQAATERDNRAEIARRRYQSTFTLDRVADAMVAFYDRALGERSP